MFWNDPTVSKTVLKGKTKNIPEAINFASKAINSPIVDSMLDDYMNEIGKQVVEQINQALDDTANF